MDDLKNYLDGSIYAQDFSNGILFDDIYNMSRKLYAEIKLELFITAIVVIEWLTIDGSK